MPATASVPSVRNIVRLATELDHLGYSTIGTNTASGDLPAEGCGRSLVVRIGALEPTFTPVIGHPTDNGIETAIDRVVASAPPLTLTQRERLAIVLGGGAA